MRGLAFAVPLVLFSGCFSEVISDPPETSCGTSNLPATSAIAGNEVSWAGRNFTALEDDVRLTVTGDGIDLLEGAWWGRAARAWSVVAYGMGEKPTVVEARAGLAEYDGSQTNINVNGGGTHQFDDAQMGGAFEEIALTLNQGDGVFVVGAADARLDSLGVMLRWTGCGSTGETVWGTDGGLVVGWPDLKGPVVLERADTGALAYQAEYKASTGSGVVLARAPPGGDATGQNTAQVTTSAGTVDLASNALSFFVHESGEIRYDATHVGEAGQEPLLAFLGMDVEG